MICSYNILTPVTFGAGAVGESGAVCERLGCKKALVVTEKAIASLGITGKVSASLEKAGISFEIFDEVVQDAPDYAVDAGAKLAKACGAEAVIGVGGGSTLDTAKAIAVLAGSGITIEELLIPGPPVERPKLKVIMVPTTFGTGSECTQIAVIHDTKNNYKNGVGAIPDAAIVDPELTLGLPKGITVYTGMDAFSHCNEAICSNLVENPHSDVLAYDGMERIIKYLPIAAENLNDLEARENLAIASNFGGIAFADAIVNLGHAIAHAVGASFHIPHGIVCAWVTPVIMEFMAPACGDKYRKVAKIMGLDVTGCSDEQVGKACADWFRAFMKKLEVPTCTSFGLSKEDFISCTDYLKNEGMTNFGKRVPSPEEIPEILAFVYESCK